MSKINWRRVLLGGLGAGLIINAVELVVGTLMRTDMSAAVMRFGLSLEDSGVTAWLAVIGFGYGIFAVWLYAAIRPRFGPGPWTAVCAGIAELAASVGR